MTSQQSRNMKRFSWTERERERERGEREGRVQGRGCTFSAKEFMFDFMQDTESVWKKKS